MTSQTLRPWLYIGILCFGLLGCSTPRANYQVSSDFSAEYPSRLIVKAQVYQKAQIGSLAYTRKVGAEDGAQSAWDGPWTSFEAAEAAFIFVPVELAARTILSVGGAIAGSASGVDQTEAEIFAAQNGIRVGFQPKNLETDIQNSLVVHLQRFGRVVGISCVGDRDKCQNYSKAEVVYMSAEYMIVRAQTPKGPADIDLLAEITIAQTSRMVNWSCGAWQYRKALGDLFAAGRNEGAIIASAMKSSAEDITFATATQFSRKRPVGFEGGATYSEIKANDGVCSINRGFANEIKRQPNAT